MDDIVRVRALAFDIDFTVKKEPKLIQSLLDFIDTQLIGELRPSLVVDSGGGFQLIYLLNKFFNIHLYRPAIDIKQEEINDRIRSLRALIKRIADEFEALLRRQVPSSLPIKIDNMSNLDRVMRLPGTINFPKAEKVARGQVPALAHISCDDYQVKCDIKALRAKSPWKPDRDCDQLKRATPYEPRPNPSMAFISKGKRMLPVHT